MIYENLKHKLLEDVEEIINTLACNELQPIEVRGAFNAAINLRSMLEQISEADMFTEKKQEIVKEEIVKEEPTKWTLPEVKPKKDKE